MAAFFLQSFPEAFSPRGSHIRTHMPILARSLALAEVEREGRKDTRKKAIRVLGRQRRLRRDETGEPASGRGRRLNGGGGGGGIAVSWKSLKGRQRPRGAAPPVDARAPDPETGSHLGVVAVGVGESNKSSSV